MNRLRVAGVSVFIVLAILATTYYVTMSVSTLLAKSNSSHVQRWETDLILLRDTLPQKHKSLFFRIYKDEFYQKMNALIASVPESDERTLTAELYQLINAIGDSHTRLSIPEKLFYPVGFFVFEEGIYVRNTDEMYRESFRKKLIAIEGLTIDEAIEKLKPFYPHDNAFIEKFYVARYLRDPHMLYLSGICSSQEQVTYTLEDNTKVTMQAIPYDNAPELTSVADQRLSLLSRKHAEKGYWFEQLANNVVYVKYNECEDTKDYPVSAFAADVFAAIDQNKSTKLIIDLRDNFGGNSALFEPFLEGIKDRPSINTPENLKVIIGRATFSSAMDNAIELKQQTNALMIGEPTGGKPNSYGEVLVLKLPNIEMDVRYSTRFFQMVDDDPDALYPDVLCTVKAEDWFNNHDSFLEAALQ